MTPDKCLEQIRQGQRSKKNYQRGQKAKFYPPPEPGQSGEKLHGEMTWDWSEYHPYSIVHTCRLWICFPPHGSRRYCGSNRDEENMNLNHYRSWSYVS